MLGRLVAAAQHLEHVAAGDQLDLALQQVDRAVILLAFLEDDIAGRHLLRLGAAGQLLDVLAVERVDRHQLAEDLLVYHLTFRAGHSVGAGDRGGLSLAQRG